MSALPMTEKEAAAMAEMQAVMQRNIEAKIVAAMLGRDASACTYAPTPADPEGENYEHVMTEDKLIFEMLMLQP